jgi:hypothetical protein
VTEEPASRTIAEAVKAPFGFDEPKAHHGRPASWVVTTLVIVGFVVGGIGLCVGPSWVLFWLGAGIVVIAGILGAAVRIFDDWY